MTNTPASYLATWLRRYYLGNTMFDWLLGLSLAYYCLFTGLWLAAFCFAIMFSCLALDGYRHEG